MAKKALAVAPPLEDHIVEAVPEKKTRKRSKVQPIFEPAEEPADEKVYFDEELYIRTATPYAQMTYAGTPVMLIGRNELFDLLFSSEWFKQRTLKQLREKTFDLERDGVPAYSIRVANKQDIIDLASQGIRQTTIIRAVEKDKVRRANTETTVQHDDGTVTVRLPKATRTARIPGVSKARGGVEFPFTLPTGKALENRLANMPKQARLIMEIIVEAGQGQARLNGEALDSILQAGGPGKGIDAKIVPLLLQRLKAFIRDGVYDGLVTKEESK